MKRRNRRKKKVHFGRIFAALLIIVAVVIAAVVFVKFDKKPEKVVKSTQQSSSKIIQSSKKELPKTQAVKWLNTKADNELPIMMYHAVLPNPQDTNTIDPTTFESDLKALQDNHYTTVSSDDALKILTTHTIPSAKVVWLTFDDSLDNFYSNVFPLLKKYKMHATSFVITGNVGKAGFLTEAQIKEMAASGLVDFQSHTVTHTDLSLATDDQQTTELQQSKAYLDKLLNQKTFVICYPSGSHNEDTAQIATNLGYKMGLLDPGRTYGNDVAKNLPATASTGMFLLNRYRTFPDMNGTSLMSTLADAENYNTQNVIN